MASRAASDRSRSRADSHGWSTVDELVTKLRRRWDRGAFLRAYVEGAEFEPLSLPVRSPKAADLVERFDDSMGWIERFDADNRTGTARQRFAVERQVRRNRTLGDNAVPVRVHVESLAQLCSILGTTDDVERLDAVLERTRADESTRPHRGELVEWIAAHPHEAIANGEVWAEVLAVVDWIVEHDDRSELDLRHLDVARVDTKFVERHRKVLSRLLDVVLPAERIDRTASTFAGRYGFRARPTHVRFRLLAPVPELPAVITEAELRVDELARLPLSVRTVFVVENRASYLAFPQVDDALAIFGAGFGVSVLEGIPWLAERDVVYWGDIDTHGFAILDRLRQRLPHVQSLLMDRATLLAHREHLVVEDRPTDEPLTTLTAQEQALYGDLVEDRYGPSVRLEQERIRFSTVSDAVSPWSSAGTR
ncbi:MAG: hypothetical protein JJU45_05780 [Acidimicrobiia bacterium]|nr:hypothetical protein [Acidimicrobiia bacterium]